MKTKKARRTRVTKRIRRSASPNCNRRLRSATTGDLSEAARPSLDNRKPTRVWHYTTGRRIRQIEAEGVIRTSRHVVGKEKEAVWFSSNPVWEKTAAKGRFDLITRKHETLLDMNEYEEFFLGLCRIGVEPETAPHNWNEFRRLSGILQMHANALEGRGFQLGARASEWFVSSEPVPRSKWISIEVWKNGIWQSSDARYTHLAKAA